MNIGFIYMMIVCMLIPQNLLHFARFLCDQKLCQGSVLERSLAGNLWQLQDVRTTLAEGFDVLDWDGWMVRMGADGGWCLAVRIPVVG